jgi:hypothetical protein
MRVRYLQRSEDLGSHGGPVLGLEGFLERDKDGGRLNGAVAVGDGVASEGFAAVQNFGSWEPQHSAISTGVN